MFAEFLPLEMLGNQSLRMGTDKLGIGNRTGWIRKDPTESDENRKRGHMCKYVPMCLLRLYL